MTAAKAKAKTTRKPIPSSQPTKSPLDGPLREVVYIFKREGARGASLWLLVLTCGHSATRPRVNPATHTLFRPLSEKLAPKRVQCMYCGSGCESGDPWVLIEAFGGLKRP